MSSCRLFEEGQEAWKDWVQRLVLAMRVCKVSSVFDVYVFLSGVFYVSSVASVRVVCVLDCVRVRL